MITFIFVWVMVGLCLGLTVTFIDYLNHCTIDRMYTGLIIGCVFLGVPLIIVMCTHWITDMWSNFRRYDT